MTETYQTPEQAQPTTPDQDAKDQQEQRRQARYWHNQIKAAQVREEDWRKRAEKINKRYLDKEQGDYDRRGDDKKVNILWSNTEVLKAALYSQLGDPDVRRAFPKAGPDNSASRTAAIILERSLTACGQRYDIDAQFEGGVFDMVLPGRGNVWLEYEPNLDENDQPTYQEAKIVHVCWNKWLHGPGQRWEEVPWVAREHLMDKESVREAWGDDIANRAQYNEVLTEGQGFEYEADRAEFHRAKAWEIWDKKSRERIYIIEGIHEIVQRDDDPYRLEDFFPCPKPIISVCGPDSLMPEPEFAQYQDQAAELDRINTRIYRLVEAMKYCGVYAADSEDADVLADIGNLQDNQFAPIKSFAQLQAKGGLANLFQARDLVPIAQAIDQLTQRGIQLMQQIYEVMGIADIMRGASDPSETLGAQQMKAQFGSQRLRKRQREVARWVRGALRAKAEIIAEYFEREQLQEMSGILLPTRDEIAQAKAALQQIQQAKQQVAQMQKVAQQQAQQGGQQQGAQQPGQMMQGAGMGMQGPQQDAQEQMQQLAATPPEKIKHLSEVAESSPWEDVRDILRSDDRRNNKIDVETDMTAFEETDEEKKQRIEFVQSMLQMLGEIVPAMQGNQAMAKYGKELALFGHRAFKVGRGLEESLEEAFDGMGQQQQQPDPAVEREKMKLQIEQARFKLDQAKAQQDMKQKQAEFQARTQERQMDMAAKQQDQQFDQASKVADLQHARAQQQLDMSAKQLDLVARSYEHGLKREEMTLENLSSLLDYELKRRQLEMQEQEGEREAA